MRGDEPEHVRALVARCMVDHLVRTGGTLATPADPIAKVRRVVLRGLRDAGLR